MIIAFMLLLGCEPDAPLEQSGLDVVTALPTIDWEDTVQLCSYILQQWNTDWGQVIEALERLEAMREACAEDDPDVGGRLYTAYVAYGTQLERNGREDDAVRAYQTALQYNFAGREVIQRLQHLRILTPEPPPSCDADVVSSVNELTPAYEPTIGHYVKIQDGVLTLNGRPYTVYGMNFYPRDYPFERFLTQMNVENTTFELDVMQAAGINTLRLFLDHNDLFICPGNGAISIPANLERLDKLIHRASERGFKIILVLNHQADLVAYPLYELPEHTREQILYLARRYRNEPAVMAFDVRSLGDKDYGQFDRTTILEWLSEVVQLVKTTAPHHLVTAGWDDDSTSTAPLVDFVSFEHSGSIEELRQEIAVLSAETTRPLLLASVGYNTYEMDEISQRQLYQRVFEAVQQNGLAGWVIWTAFDFPASVTCMEPNCPAEDSAINHAGIWSASYYPKRALEAIQMMTAVES